MKVVVVVAMIVGTLGYAAMSNAAHTIADHNQRIEQILNESN